MSLLTLDIERPAAGGRMVARHDGQVVLVAGAIPGERVRARVVRREKRVAFADTVEVLTPSIDRRPVSWDVRCGGSVFAHVAYTRQVALKAEIIQDAFRRIGRMPVPPPAMMASPEEGYRMRARLHVRGSRVGFYLEGSHDVCDAAPTAQLLPSTVAWIAGVRDILASRGLSDATSIEIAENRAGDARVGHVELAAGVDAGSYTALADGLVGLSARSGDGAVLELTGSLAVIDGIRPNDLTSVDLRRGPRSFFQSNRFLVEPLVRHVLERVPAGPVVDLYAGVGLLGLSVAAVGNDPVTLVEGDPTSSRDLETNARPFRNRVGLHRLSVEAFLQTLGASDLRASTAIVDPPRTGLSPAAAAGVGRLAPPRIVYVSCDVATLARDARLLSDAGYRLDDLTGIDLFPNTAHVESVAVFSRP